MNKILGITASLIFTLASLSANAFTGEPKSTIRCEYQTGYGEGAFYLGYDFNLVSKSFENLVTHSAGQIQQAQGLDYNFSEPTGDGSLTFGPEFNYALLTLSNLSNPVPFVLKCH